MILFNKVLSRVFYSTLQISFKNRTQSVRSLALKPSYHLCPNKTVFSAINGFVGKKGKSLVGAEYKFTQVRAMGALSPLDPSSFSRPELAVVKHISLSLSVDFDNKILSGTATLNVDVLDDISEVILDVRNLNIESIESDNGERLKYTIGEEVPTFGSKLSITLPKDVHSGEKHPTSGTHEVPQASTSTASKHDMKLSYTGFVYEPADVAASDMRDAHIQTDKCPCDCLGCSKVDTCYGVNSSGNSRDGLKLKIKYSTVPTASALQWLDPNQTSGKKHPYMFSQCQPIHARSILPCQDTPAVKFTYDAEVIAPEEFTVLMSALRGETKGNRTSFKQPMPLPSYLVAIAVGVLEFRSLGPRSKVWAEKQEIEASAWEFAETEKFLQAAEKLCGPYEWTEYDLLVLPPSFPYGGMENPCLTFVTPTLLAGDRSLADVIVHEIMHSWTGNLVTNRNFEHFWLNEGFTVFLERKVGASLITDTVEAKKSRDFHSILGLQELKEAVYQQGVDNTLTRLVPDLNGVHPDDSFSRVPYEKGSLFLRYLEDLLGGPEVFDDFLRSYLNKFSKKSLDTDEFKAYLLSYFKNNDKLQTVDWNAWFYTSGMPPVIPEYDTSMTKSVNDLIERISTNATFSYEDISGFTPHQMINFLQSLVDRPALNLETLRNLGEAYRLEASKNAEIKFRWLRLCVRSRDQSKLTEVFQFLNSQGRMKYVRPVYRDLYAWEDVRDQAIDNFLKNEKYMMHVSAYTVRKDLHLDD